MKVFLFDIDGTILLSGGAGLRAMNRVFVNRFGIPNAFEGFQFQGKVDPAIFREALAANRLAVPDIDAEIRHMIVEYEGYIAEEMPHSAKAMIYPGIRELLASLHGRADVSLGLLTGNVYGGAKTKLSHFDLWRYFPYGAFGSDCEDRPSLVPIALERASKHLNRVVRPGENVYIIGDTDRDIMTAKAHHCVAVGVGACGFTAAQLAALGADIVFPDLSDTQDVLRKLGVTDDRPDRPLSEDPRPAS
jgi:phosphoglycolate phosphatase